MTHRVLVLLTLSASVALPSVAQAGASRREPLTAIRPATAEPLCGGNGTKNPPEGPQPPKEPPKT